MSLTPLQTDQLYRHCDQGLLAFSTTAELHDGEAVFAQDRALNAIRFGIGIGIEHRGYNLYLAGSTGLGKHTVVQNILQQRARKASVPEDICFVNNFVHSHQPLVLTLPTGMGARLRADMKQLVNELLTALPAAFQSDEYRTRAQEINDEFQEQEESAFIDLGERAKQKGVMLLRTPSGYTLAPEQEGQPMEAEAFDKLPAEQQEQLQALISELKGELKLLVRQIPSWRRESATRFKALDEEFTRLTVDPLIEELKQNYRTLPELIAYLDQVQEDLVANVDDFRGRVVETDGEDEEDSPFPLGTGESRKRKLQRFEVNVVVDNSTTVGAPIIYEDNPTYQNLVGRIEHLAQMGTFYTNFSLIKAGALLRANGGYLLLDAEKLLSNPYSWEALKRILRSSELRIESPEQMLSLVSTISLSPKAVPIRLKVILMGDRGLYYSLREYDPEFGLLFKVIADFSESTRRDQEMVMHYAHLVAAQLQREKMRPMSRSGVARVIEQSARQVEDSQKLSLHMGQLTDLLREADYWACSESASRIEAAHVQRAIDERIARSDQYRERLYEEMQDGTVMIATRGTQIGQVNGLSVLQLADFAFGQPSRITATARLGEWELVDIERETEMGGDIHTKGVLILTSYLAHRYASDMPLSLSASLVFEQSYGLVDGDSASVAELCALLSAIAQLPIKQGLAVTGSLNQLGEVQAIGGVNEKVEGFFDVCQLQGLTGEQGVVIPASNVRHLMLRADVVEAVAAGRFAIYAAHRADEVIELLTGIPAGEADDEGEYPEGSVNDRVTERLKQLTLLRQQHEHEHRGDGGDDGE